MEFINPKGRKRLIFPRLQLLKGHIGSILRAQLSTGERARCFFAILQYLLQIRKWKQIIIKFFTGAGTGQGYLEAVEMLEKSDHTAQMTGSKQAVSWSHLQKSISSLDAGRPMKSDR